MRLLIRTKTNSLYEIDQDNKTWARRQSTPESGHIRGDNYGSYLDIGKVVEGCPLILILDPYELGGPTRTIITSDIVAVERLPDEVQRIDETTV